MQKYVNIESTSQIHLTSAQIALLEWSTVVHDLITVSIHTYERAPQLVIRALHDSGYFIETAS